MGDQDYLEECREAVVKLEADLDIAYATHEKIRLEIIKIADDVHPRWKDILKRLRYELNEQAIFLETRIKKLEEIEQYYVDCIDFAPGGPGYEEAKKEFAQLSQP